jgi:hypothetical protein
VNGFLPWWGTALALGALTVGYWIVVRRPLGVSGVLSRFTRVGEELEFDRGVAAVTGVDQAALEAEMLAMTLEAFGDTGENRPAQAPPAAPGAEAAAGVMEPAAHASVTGRACAPVPPLGAHFTFLAMLVAGGALVALLRGSWGAGLGAEFAARIAGGPGSLGVLAGGGLLIGFGTALCGGCSAGHGLTGTGRLMPGSLVSTGVYFAAAVATALLLSGRAG